MCVCDMGIIGSQLTHGYTVHSTEAYWVAILSSGQPGRTRACELPLPQSFHPQTAGMLGSPNYCHHLVREELGCHGNCHAREGLGCHRNCHVKEELGCHGNCLVRES